MVFYSGQDVEARGFQMTIQCAEAPNAPIVEDQLVIMMIAEAVQSGHTVSLLV